MVALAAPAQAVSDAQTGAAQAGYPELWPLLLAIAGPESSYNPGAIGDNGCSFGYLQFNTCGGLGVGVPIGELLDGVANMTRGARIIGERIGQGWTLWSALEPWSTRPQALALYRQFLDEHHADPGPTPPVPGPSGGEQPAPPGPDGAPPADDGQQRARLLGFGLVVLALVLLTD